MKFKFQSVNDDGCCTTQEFESSTWVEALDYFAKFLKGSGFGVSNESIGVNEDRHTFDSLMYSNITPFSNE